LFLLVSVRRAIKQTVLIIGAYHFTNYVHYYIQHPAVKVNSICRGICGGSSTWIPTQQVNYWSCILHSSNTRKKVGIQWSSAL